MFFMELEIRKGFIPPLQQVAKWAIKVQTGVGLIGSVYHLTLLRVF